MCEKKPVILSLVIISAIIIMPLKYTHLPWKFVYRKDSTKLIQIFAKQLISSIFLSSSLELLDNPFSWTV